MSLKETFPPLYTCSICNRGIKVVPKGIGEEPEYIYHKDCSHRDVIIHANRKVTLIGKGQLNQFEEIKYKVTVSARQFLSWLTGRSI